MTGFGQGALIAGGLLAADGALDPTLTASAATRRLTELLDDSTLWRRADYGAELQSRELAMHPAPAANWVSPDASVVDAVRSTLDDAWSGAIAAHLTGRMAEVGQPDYPPLIVRLTVPDVASANELTTIDVPGSPRIVPLIAAPANRFGWRWPLRVGVLAGSRAEQWREQMTDSWHAGRLYEVQVVEHSGLWDLDILVIDDDTVPPLGPERALLQRGQVACVIVVGDRKPAHHLLERAEAELYPAVAAGVTAPDAAWFVGFFHELSHDQPIDVALVLATSQVRVSGDPELVNLTAVGRWAAAVAAERADGDGTYGTVEELRRILVHGDFTFESHAATEICDAVRHLVGTAGELVVDRGTPAAHPPPPDAPTVPRRLIAEIVRGEEVCWRALTPYTEHQLEVQIGYRRPQVTACGSQRKRCPKGTASSGSTSGSPVRTSGCMHRRRSTCRPRTVRSQAR